MLQAAFEQVVKIEPHRILGKRAITVNDLKNRIDTVIKSVINQNKIALTAVSNRLVGLNPRAVLKRGYTITTNRKTGTVVRKPDDIKIGDSLITELDEKKTIESTVTKK